MAPRYIFSIIFLLQCASPVFSQGNTSGKYWIIFTDKPAANLSLEKTILQNLPVRTIDRRKKNNTLEKTIDHYDIPVNTHYTDYIKSLHIEIIAVSKWLNAVSVHLNAEQKTIVEKLAFVKLVKPVSRAQTNVLIKQKNKLTTDGKIPFILDYGSSYSQNAMINTPAVHQLGFSGSGVLIGMIDTGFNLDHIALRNVHVVDDSDFVERDKDVSENIAGKGGSSHGTYVLSTIAAYDPGKLIGTAFGASYLLARTENDDGIGQKAEEDHWIAALEWLEEKGADIVSSSISFFDEFQNSSYNYSLSDLDGNTAMTTLATNIAFNKGVLVFNSAGNMGTRGAGYLGTPSDGKKMIAVGAIYGDSTVTTFSSRGPTTDERKKPDVAALGYSVTVVAPDTNGYYFLDGTSLSTPLTAGLAALALEANPRWSSKQLYDAIRKTANSSSNPNNEIGFGIPNALKALNYDPSGSSNPLVKNILTYPNPASGTIYISFQSLVTSTFTIKIYNSIGQFVISIAEHEPVSSNQIITKNWNGKNFNGNEVSSGVYFYRISLGGKSTAEKILIVK